MDCGETNHKYTSKNFSMLDMHILRSYLSSEIGNFEWIELNIQLYKKRSGHLMSYRHNYFLAYSKELRACLREIHANWFRSKVLISTKELVQLKDLSIRSLHEKKFVRKIQDGRPTVHYGLKPIFMKFWPCFIWKSNISFAPYFKLHS